MNNNHRNKEQEMFFDGISGQYNQKSSAHLESQEFFRIKTSQYIKGTVLDIGNGGIISFDFEKAEKVTVADIAMKMLKNLKRVYKGQYYPVNKDDIECKKADVRKMPFGNNCFDVVVMLTTAHHLSESSLEKTVQNINKAFSEIHRVLKPKGVFLMVEVHPCSPLKLVQDLFFELAYGIFILFGKPLPYFMSRSQAKEYLKKAGLILKKEIIVPSGKRVYMPLFPFFSPPGWLWNRLLSSVLFISVKN